MALHLYKKCCTYNRSDKPLQNAFLIFYTKVPSLLVFRTAKYIFFQYHESMEINMNKPATRKETSARRAAIWLCEEYNGIKLDIYNISSLLNVLSLQVHHCISNHNRSSSRTVTRL